MNRRSRQNQISIAVVAALGAAAIGSAPGAAVAGKTEGQYVSGDFHNHTTCSDGSISMQKLVKKSMDKTDTPWGLDWFVQAGHGGRGNRNCTLAEDASLATPGYPLVYSTSGALLGPDTTWQSTNPAVQPKGLVSGSSPNQNMWRWQSLQEYQYPLLEYLNVYLNKPLFLGLETVVPGHEHTSMSIITGQIPAGLDARPLPTTGGYSALGNANALSQWEYCFDRNDTDTSRGNTTTTSGVGNNWNCSVPGSLNAADPSWNDAAKKLMPVSPDVGVKGNRKTLEALKWMQAYHPNTSYYVPAHLERAGPFNPQGNNGFNVDNLRDFNNTAPAVAFGFETQPGHHASDQRGEYTLRRNSITVAGVAVNVDSVGGTTYGGTGVYGAQIGGVWDALLGEGRNWWFFGSSDWHNRGSFGPDDRRSTQDFYPGEYQRNYTMVRNGGGPKKLTPQMIVDGLRTGNTFVSSGQLVDRLAFVACIGNPAPHGRSNAAVEALATNAARKATDIDFKGCATMGEKLVVPAGSDVVISIVLRDPQGTNYSPYVFPNPSLAQVGITQPMNEPVLDHVDVIRGFVSGKRSPGSASYAGAWPNDWINPYLVGGTPSLDTVPAAAKNTTASLLRTFNGTTWSASPGDGEFTRMTFRIPAVTSSQYVRLRGSNLPASVPWETDANGDPLPDVWTNDAAVRSVTGSSIQYPAGYFLQIPCRTAGTNLPSNGVTYKGASINGCPEHMPVKNGVKYTAYDVAAWADLWFYSNPIYIEVDVATRVAGL